MTRFDASEVRRYYDRHTPAFVTFGQGGRTGAIHRAVWGPGVHTRQQAFHYVDERIAELTQSLLDERPATKDQRPATRDQRPATRDQRPETHVVDLGCGVGTSLCYLAGRLPIRATGITLSPVQANLAADRIRDAALSDRVRCIEGDYCDIPPDVEPADLAFAIESFVHAPAPGAFLASCARLIRPGGLLVVCDDFQRSPVGVAAAQAIERFRRGWHVNTLLSAEEVQDLARAFGFEHRSTVDLTPALELGRARDRAIGLLSRLAGWLPIGARRLDYLLGGSALQECLERGWIGYDLIVFRRIA